MKGSTRIVNCLGLCVFFESEKNEYCDDDDDDEKKSIK